MSQHGCPERLSSRSKSCDEAGPSVPNMEILVETLTGTAFEMTVSPSDTILAIKSKIFRVEGIPVSQQHILYNLKELEDSSSLGEHGISDGARLRLVLGMRGGPISTRRLHPASSIDASWRDIERLLDSRDDLSCSNNCKVTVLVVRDGDRVSMLRVKENEDGTYTPIDLNKYSSSLKSLVEESTDEPVSSGVENVRTANKMMDLRNRMEGMGLRRTSRGSGKKSELIQKTRSEETLSVSSLLDDSSVDYKGRTFGPFDEQEPFTPLYDGDYIRYDYDCAFPEHYTLLPPIGTRTESNQSVQDSVSSDSERMLNEVSKRRNDDCLKRDSKVGGTQSEYGSVVMSTWHNSLPLSTSSSDLPSLHLLPLSRHPPSSHLHLSDDLLLRHSSKKRLRCAFCRKKLSIATEHHCRCGERFCAPHRYAEVHGCAFDYKAHGQQFLQRANPLVSAPKLPKI